MVRGGVFFAHLLTLAVAAWIGDTRPASTTVPGGPRQTVAAGQPAGSIPARSIEGASMDYYREQPPRPPGPPWKWFVVGVLFGVVAVLTSNVWL